MMVLSAGAQLPAELWDDCFEDDAPKPRQAKEALAPMLARVRAGTMHFGELARRTPEVWRGLAAYLYAKWTTPAACTADDVEQELLLAAWAAIPQWDPARGNTLAEYVVWNACTKAKLWIHRQRGANLHGNRGKNPGRFHQPTSRYGLRPDGQVDVAAEVRGAAAATRVAAQQPTQEDAAESSQRAAQLYERLALAAPTRVLAWVMTELARDWNPDGAAARLWADPDKRRRMRLGNEQEARAEVRRAVEWAARHEGVEPAEENA